MKCKINYKRGFTLIELLVVVLIISILASVAMPQYFKSVEKSRSAEAIGIINSIADAQEREYIKNGSYTSTLSNLDVAVNGLEYFTFTSINTDGGTFKSIRLDRLTEAGGRLGKYFINIRIPLIPGTGARTWTCQASGIFNSPLCKSMSCAFTLTAYRLKHKSSGTVSYNQVNFVE